MSFTLLAWLALAAVLAVKSVQRPSYAVGLYMLTFFANPLFWWWGNEIQGIRWNFIAANVLLGTLVLARARQLGENGRPLSTNAVRILAFMAVNCALVHFTMAVNPDSSVGWLTNRLKFILLFFILQYSVKDEDDYRIVAMAIALGMGYIGYEATINERGSFSGGRLEGIGAAGVTSSNQLASLFITGLPLATSYIFSVASQWKKGLVILCCALTLNVVLMCNSRGAFLGVLLGGLVFMLMASGPARRHSKRLAALAVIGTFFLMGDPEIPKRFMTTFTSEADQDHSAQSRIIFWTAASRMLLDYPLGSGGNSFSEGRGWAYMPNARTKPGDTRAIHNGFITEATDWGIQGFLLMLLFLGAVFRAIFRGRRLALTSGDGSAVMVYGCMAAALIGWIVSSVFGDYLDQEWGFWVGAMTYAYMRVHTLASVPKPVLEPEPAPTRLRPFAPAMPRSSVR